MPPLPAEPVPPLPTETAPPLPAEQPPLPEAQPVTELGGDDDDEEEDGEKADGDDKDDDEDEDDAEPSTSAAKGKGKADSNAWQAVWSPERNGELPCADPKLTPAYYFWNTETDEVTWVNPLAPASDASAPPLPNEPAPSAPASSSAPRAAPTTAPEMDPALAFLLPPEARTSDGSSAMFNARTGRFTPVDYAYSVTHLDEWNRAKRMSERFFDVDGWEKQKAAENAKRKADEAAGVVRETKITKKDMVSGA